MIITNRVEENGDRYLRPQFTSMFSPNPLKEVADYLGYAETDGYFEGLISGDVKRRIAEAIAGLDS